MNGAVTAHLDVHLGTNIAYTRYVLDTSMQGDLLDARVVTAPCLIGYGRTFRSTAECDAKDSMD
jgi:thiaminase